MKCLFCGHMESRVLDSRIVGNGAAVRRRRECGRCGRRYTTMEKIEQEPIMVIKRDGRRELFDRDKVLAGLIMAGRKRGISRDVWKRLAEELEQSLRERRIREVPSAFIGDYLLHRLRDVDVVAYVRFASVFHRFANMETFKNEVDRLIREKETRKQQ